MYRVCYFRDIAIKMEEGLCFAGHQTDESKGPEACGFPLCQRMQFASKFHFKSQ